MANYIFQKEAQLRLVCDDVGGTLRNYRIDINEIEFSQSFQEKSYSVKTIHNQSSFEGSSINRANPAEFSFSTPLLEEARHKVVFDRLLDCKSFDLYISSGQDVFKLDKCIIQDGTFEINKSRPLRLSISGEASKLSKFSGSIPGTVDTGLGYDTTTYIIPKINTLTLGGTDVSGQVVGVTVEVQNDINWNNYNTLQASVTATNAATSMFPSTFTIGTRVVAGAITRYIKDSPDLLTWDTNTALVLKAGTVGSFKGVSFDFNCSFTNRLQSSGIYAEEYSWRMTERPTALSSVITYT
tara:strand:- start:3208 stop:4098 length:891 start_codon:yes stop_codon:yes gene_type:complete